MSFGAYTGRRFAGLVLVCLLLIIAYFNPNEHFTILASTLGLMYGVYVGGQSFTDGRKNGATG